MTVTFFFTSFFPLKDFTEGRYEVTLNALLVNDGDIEDLGLVLQAVSKEQQSSLQSLFRELGNVSEKRNNKMLHQG